MNFLIVTLLTLASLFFSVDEKKSIAQPPNVRDLRVEYLQNPLGIDMPHPRFSWKLASDQRGVSQASYQVVVATSPEKLTDAGADVWNTGKVSSDQSVNVVYDGKALKPNQTYYWKTKVWNEGGEASAWSSMAQFHVGPMENSDWSATWISAPDSATSAPLMRKEFDLKKNVKEAYAYIVGLGYYELYLNGDKVGDHVLDPGTTDFFKRALYATYDVTKYIRVDSNAVGVWLGNGYLRHKETRQYADRPQLLFQLHVTYEDGSENTFVSDRSWKSSPSPITKNSIYDGEVYDAREEQDGWSISGFDDSEWDKVVQADVSDDRAITSQLMPPIRVTKTIRPVSLREPVEGTYVFDFGQNLSGWPRLHVTGGEGEEVVMRTAEITQKDMARMKNQPFKDRVDTINTVPNRSAKARDVYILKGDNQGEVYEPRFTYQGFRYVQVDGLHDKPDLRTLEARVVHSDVKKTGSFSCSNTLLNQIHENTLWGQLANLQSMPTDCPQRNERMGWMGDAHLTAEEAMYNFDMAAFYAKWLQDIKTEQNEDGSVPDVVPGHNYRPVGTPAWQVAYPLIVWYMYKHYGDRRVLEHHYESLKKWMEYMHSISNDYIITKGRGDWVPPRIAFEPIDDSVPITSTGYYYEGARIVTDIAKVLGKQNDEQKYEQLRENIKSAFNNKFWNPETQSYGNGSQTSNAFPLYLGMVPEDKTGAVAENLVRQINGEDDGHIQTGILGTKALVESLPKYGHSDVLYDMTNNTEFPGWGYMVAKGSTTLWERWGGYRYFNAEMNSLNHIMFGSIDEFLYKDIAGIKPEEPGYKTVSITPHIPGKIDYAQASTETVYGTVSSSWKVQGRSISLDVEIPANTKAMVRIPKNDFSGPFTLNESGIVIWKDGQQLKSQNGIRSIEENGDYIEVKTGSGRYHFELMGWKE